ncbi:MAG: dihydropteroate synthase [Actinomycetota bacterium]
MLAGPSVMGIINVTPDSFFPSSRVVNEGAIARGLEMFEQGADIVDVGGESTRPGATEVSVAEELTRVSEVVRALSLRGPVSIDTSKPEVARAAVSAGAVVINDVSATLDTLAGELGVGYVAMHRQGDSRTMQINPHYDDVVAEVEEFLLKVAARAQAAGVRQLWLDPGIGFGKNTEHNVDLLAATPRLAAAAQACGAGLLVGTSRKRFLGEISGDALEVDERFESSLASAAYTLLQGATMVRVHDVLAAVQLRELILRPTEEVIT